MCIILPPHHHGQHLQHLYRSDHVVDTNPIACQSPIATEKVHKQHCSIIHLASVTNTTPFYQEARPLRHLLPRRLRHPRCDPQPLLQLHLGLRLPHLPELVCRRRRNQHHGLKHPALLAPTGDDLRARQLQVKPQRGSGKQELRDEWQKQHTREPHPA